jgi:hypothetical protein
VNGSRRTIAALALALAGAVSVPAAAATAGGSAPVHVSPAIASAPNELTVDVNPSAMSPRRQSPSALSFSLPRGMTLDLGSRTRRCSLAQATAINCPAASNVGFGHAVVHVAGYLDPGGDIDLVAYMRTFLGQPAVPGDPASLVFEVQLLGVGRLEQALKQHFGITVPVTSSIVARVIRLGAGPYGLMVRLDSLPGGWSVPAPVTVQLKRFKVQIGAVVLRRVNFVRRYRVQTMNGPRILLVHDHKLVGHYLLRNPTRCTSTWPFALGAGFPAGTETFVVHTRCSRGRIPLAPPPSPSAPERA